MRVTPRSSRAAAAPTAERRCATLSMAAASSGRAVGAGAAIAPPLPKPDDAVGRPEHDDEKAEADQQPEAVAVEPDREQEVERESAQQHEDQAPMNGPIGRVTPPTTAMISMSIAASTLTEPGEICP